MANYKQRRAACMQVLASIVVATLTVVGVNVFAANSERRVTSPSGQVLYIEHGDGRVTNGQAKLLGYVKGDRVTDASGRLVAKNGDAGLLYCLAK